MGGKVEVIKCLGAQAYSRRIPHTRACQSDLATLGEMQKKSDCCAMSESELICGKQDRQGTLAEY